MVDEEVIVAPTYSQRYERSKDSTPCFLESRYILSVSSLFPFRRYLTQYKGRLSVPILPIQMGDFVHY